MPTEMKNMAMNRLFMGSMASLMSFAFLHPDISMPIRNAPMAMERPALLASSAIPNASPTENTITISGETLSETQLIILGMIFSPMNRLAIMNTAMETIRTTRLVTSMVDPARTGVSIDSMTTCPMSSMMVISTSMSICSLVSLFWDFRTAMTTAVLEPEMMAPSAMDWTGS